LEKSRAIQVQVEVVGGDVAAFKTGLVAQGPKYHGGKAAGPIDRADSCFPKPPNPGDLRSGLLPTVDTFRRRNKVPTEKKTPHGIDHRIFVHHILRTKKKNHKSHGVVNIVVIAKTSE
jgi:hypothetical protein